MTTNKNQAEFKVLSERDHILQRPQMYIGSTSPESINQMIDFKNRNLTVVPGLLKIELSMRLLITQLMKQLEQILNLQIKLTSK